MQCVRSAWLHFCSVRSSHQIARGNTDGPGEAKWRSSISSAKPMCTTLYPLSPHPLASNFLSLLFFVPVNAPPCCVCLSADPEWQQLVLQLFRPGKDRVPWSGSYYRISDWEARHRSSARRLEDSIDKESTGREQGGTSSSCRNMQRM